LIGNDVWNNKITTAFAQRHHGAVIDPASGEIGAAAAVALRKRMKAAVA
jgi:hypothetical protein